MLKYDHNAFNWSVSGQWSQHCGQTLLMTRLTFLKWPHWHARRTFMRKTCLPPFCVPLLVGRFEPVKDIIMKRTLQISKKSWFSQYNVYSEPRGGVLSVSKGSLSNIYLRIWYNDLIPSNERGNERERGMRERGGMREREG